MSEEAKNDNSDETKNRMEFIIEQQARFAVDIQHLKEVQAETAKQQKQFQDQLGRIGDAVITVVGLIGQVTERQTKTETAMAGLADEMKELTERLNTFISVVERHVSDDSRHH
jgi:preprotein translocase subunit YajC